MSTIFYDRNDVICYVPYIVITRISSYETGTKSESLQRFAYTAAQVTIPATMSSYWPSDELYIIVFGGYLIFSYWLMHGYQLAPLLIINLKLDSLNRRGYHRLSKWSKFHHNTARFAAEIWLYLKDRMDSHIKSISLPSDSPEVSSAAPAYGVSLHLAGTSQRSKVKRLLAWLWRSAEYKPRLTVWRCCRDVIFDTSAFMPGQTEETTPGISDSGRTNPILSSSGGSSTQ